MTEEGTAGKKLAKDAQGACASDGHHLVRRARQATVRAAKKILKNAAKVALVTAPIPGTPINMGVRFAQNTGVLPTIGRLEDQEFSYKEVIGEGFDEGIHAEPLPRVPLRHSHVNNYVIEPDGRNLPSYFLHGESPLTALDKKRMNTTILHAQEVASSYYCALKKILGREPSVKLIDGFASEGYIFNGPQVALFKKNKTIINKSVGSGAFEPDCNVDGYKAWIFFAAGNLGIGSDPNDCQPQLGGTVNHGPRSVMVGSACGATHCGPVFYALPSTHGKIRGYKSRLGFLPSEASRTSDGYAHTYKNWGGTSNASPTTAANFSGLMDHYANYLSEEQIFTALCVATSRETGARLSADLAEAKAQSHTQDESHIGELLASFEATNTAARTGRKHIYDPSLYGFGEITPEALAEAARLCQSMVIYSQYRPESITRPVSFKARLKLSERAQSNAEGVYVYKVSLPEAVNLGSVRLDGCVASECLTGETIFLSANGLKIHVPVGHTSGLKQEEWIAEGEESGFIGSTRGFTGERVKEMEVISSVPLRDDFTLTFWNTLGAQDAVSRLETIHNDVAQMQAGGKKNYALNTARIVDSAKVDPRIAATQLYLLPENVAPEEWRALQKPEQISSGPASQSYDPGVSGERHAYWRKRETDAPSAEAYTKG